MKYKWDVESITTLARRMSQEKQRVDKQIEMLEKCKSLMAASLQGDAGTAFQDALQEDILRMEELSKMIEIQEKKLRAVAKNCYEQCEETMRQKMNKIEANMK